MNTRTIAASVLALGLLASGAFAQSGSNINFCPDDQRERANYIDCLDKADSNATSSFGVAAIAIGPNQVVGDYVDETPADSNQRSSN